MRLAALIVILLMGALSAGAAEFRAPALLRHRVYVTTTGSMKPLLVGGETLDVLPIPFERVQEGYVIHIYDVAHDLNYIHLVVRILRAANGGLYFITKGINNRNVDLIHVTEAEYRGTVDMSPIPQGKR